MTWWLCPNTPPCPHGGPLHDIEDLEDQTPTCCVEGCTCGRTARRVAPARRVLTVACHAAGEKTRCGQDLTDEGELWQDVPAELDVPNCPACSGREEQETLL